MLVTNLPIVHVPVNLILVRPTVLLVDGEKCCLEDKKVECTLVYKNRKKKSQIWCRIKQILNAINSMVIRISPFIYDEEVYTIYPSMNELCSEFVDFIHSTLSSQDQFGNKFWFENTETWKELLLLVRHMARMLLQCPHYRKSDILYLLALVAIQLHYNVLTPQIVSAIVEKRTFICICLIQFYLSHCYLYDFVFPLKYWQENIFDSYNSYYSIEQLKNEVLEQFKLQNWCLKVPTKILQDLARTFGSLNTHRDFCPCS